MEADEEYYRGEDINIEKEVLTTNALQEIKEPTDHSVGSLGIRRQLLLITPKLFTIIVIPIRVKLASSVIISNHSIPIESLVSQLVLMILLANAFELLALLGSFNTVRLAVLPFIPAIVTAFFSLAPIILGLRAISSTRAYHKAPSESQRHNSFFQNIDFHMFSICFHFKLTIAKSITYATQLYSAKHFRKDDQQVR